MDNLPAERLPTDAKTGLTLPLSKSLALPDLRKHRALLAVELEVLAKKFDRFGWDKDRGSMAHDRIITDWMDALQDYPLEEVKEACKAAVTAQPNRMPNEGHILSAIMEARKSKVAALPRPLPAPEPAPAPVEKRRAFAAMVLSNAGLAHTMPKGLDE